MKNTKQKLTLSQETLRILVQEKPTKLVNNMNSTFPWCPTGGAVKLGQR